MQSKLSIAHFLAFFILYARHEVQVCIGSGPFVEIGVKKRENEKKIIKNLQPNSTGPIGPTMRPPRWAVVAKVVGGGGEGGGGDGGGGSGGDVGSGGGIS